jgi:hypothetical protein
VIKTPFAHKFLAFRITTAGDHKNKARQEGREAEPVSVR